MQWWWWDGEKYEKLIHFVVFVVLFFIFFVFSNCIHINLNIQILSIVCNIYLKAKKLEDSFFVNQVEVKSLKNQEGSWAIVVTILYNIFILFSSFIY